MIYPNYLDDDFHYPPDRDDDPAFGSGAGTFATLHTAGGSQIGATVPIKFFPAQGGISEALDPVTFINDSGVAQTVTEIRVTTEIGTPLATVPLATNGVFLAGQTMMATIKVKMT